MWLPFKKKIEKKMTAKVIGVVVRHLLTAFGAAGLVEGNDLEQVISAISIIISVIWSIVQKRADAQKNG